MDDQARARISDAMRPKVKPFPITGLPDPVYLRGLTAGQRDRFSASVWQGEGAERRRNLIDANARLVAMVWCDIDGKSLGYTEEDISEMDGALVAQLAECAVEMNGLGEKAAEDAKGNS